MTAIVAAAAARARRRRHQARRLCARPEVTFVAPLLPRLIVERVRKRRAIRRVECPRTIAAAETRMRTRCAPVRRPPPQSPHDSRSAGQVINGPGPAGQAPCRDPGPAARPAPRPVGVDGVRRRCGKPTPDLAEFSTSVRSDQNLGGRFVLDGRKGAIYSAFYSARHRSSKIFGRLTAPQDTCALQPRGYQHGALVPGEMCLG